jgi:hypothetical protein
VPDTIYGGSRASTVVEVLASGKSNIKLSAEDLRDFLFHSHSIATHVNSRV